MVAAVATYPRVLRSENEFIDVNLSQIKKGEVIYIEQGAGRNRYTYLGVFRRTITFSTNVQVDLFCLNLETGAIYDHSFGVAGCLNSITVLGENLASWKESKPDQYNALVQRVKKENPI